MFLLRRAAVRAVSAAPSKALLCKPRSITTFTPSAFRTQKQQWSLAFQRRFASDDADKTDAAQAAAADVPENFAQTAAEPPIEDGLTPAQEDAQAEPTDAKATVGAEALDKAAETVAAQPMDRRGSSGPPNNILYIGNLYYEVTAEQLKKVFSRFGKIENVKIIYDNRGLSRGFGYVMFKDMGDAQKAVDAVDMQVFEGRNIVVQFHKPRSPGDVRAASRGSGIPEPSPPSKTLFIGNMSFEMSDKDLNDLFRDIRNVMDVRVAIDRRTGQPRGFAHADFIDVASATKAKQLLQGKVIYGRELRIDFSKSNPADSRDKRADSGTLE